MRTALTLTVLGAAALLAAPLPAQPPGCAVPQQRVYVAQQAAYAPVYAAPTQKLVAQEYAAYPLYSGVPVQAAAVPVTAYGPAYYYSVGEAYREKAYLRELLREELRAFAAGNAPQPNRPAAQPVQQTPVPPAGGPAPVTQAPTADDFTPADLAGQVLEAYRGKGNCLSCHGTGRAQGPGGVEFRLVIDAGGQEKLARLPSDKRWKVYGMSSTGAMPPAAAADASKAMESKHLQALLQYAAQKDH